MLSRTEEDSAVPKRYGPVASNWSWTCSEDQRSFIKALEDGERRLCSAYATKFTKTVAFLAYACTLDGKYDIDICHRLPDDALSYINDHAPDWILHSPDAFEFFGKVLRMMYIASFFERDGGSKKCADINTKMNLLQASAVNRFVNECHDELAMLEWRQELYRRLFFTGVSNLTSIMQESMRICRHCLDTVAHLTNYYRKNFVRNYTAHQLLEDVNRDLASTSLARGHVLYDLLQGMWENDPMQLA